MSIADQFGLSSKSGRRKQQNGDPPMAGGGGSLTASGSSVTIPLRPLDSLDVLGEDAQRWFARVEQQRVVGEQMAAEVERLTKLNMRLEAELDVSHATLAAVTADRDTYLRVVTELNTKADSIAQLVLDWGTSIRNAARPSAPPVVDMDAMQAAVTEEPK